jgi:hypothetical protein
MHRSNGYCLVFRLRGTDPTLSRPPELVPDAQVHAVANAATEAGEIIVVQEAEIWCKTEHQEAQIQEHFKGYPPPNADLAGQPPTQKPDRQEN